MAPCSHSCMTAMAVKVLVIEAILKTVRSVIGVREAISANPWVWNSFMPAERTIPVARPTTGRRPTTLAILEAACDMLNRHMPDFSPERQRRRTRWPATPTRQTSIPAGSLGRREAR
jgi:hypothetical protein